MINYKYIIILILFIIIYVIHKTNNIGKFTEPVDNTLILDDIILTDINSINVLLENIDTIVTYNESMTFNNKLIINSIDASKIDTQTHLRDNNNINSSIKNIKLNYEKKIEIFPRYTIVAYTNINNIPPNWVICDGTTYYIDEKDPNNIIIYDQDDVLRETIDNYVKVTTPDLRGRFIIGENLDNKKLLQREFNHMYGNEYISMDIDQMPEHNHHTFITVPDNIISNVFYSRTYPDSTDLTKYQLTAGNMINRIADSEKSNYLHIPSLLTHLDEPTNKYYIDTENIKPVDIDIALDALSKINPSFPKSSIINTEFKNILTTNDTQDDIPLPRKTLPPYYTLCYIMKL